MNGFFARIFGLMRDYAFVTICTVVLFGAAIAGYVVRRGLAELEADHEVVRSEDDAQQKLIAGAASLRADRETIAAAAQEMSGDLLIEENLADNLGYFYKIEDQSRARISDLHQLTSPLGAANSTSKAVPFTVNVTGSFAQVFSFLYQLEHGSRLMRITAFTFDRKVQTGDNVVLELNLEMLARP
jgi:Tfp pilus assembly protein PilO